MIWWQSEDDINLANITIAETGEVQYVCTQCREIIDVNDIYIQVGEGAITPLPFFHWNCLRPYLDAHWDEEYNSVVQLLRI